MKKQNLDHKILGRKFSLFTFPRSTPGYVFWHPKGLIIYESIIGYIRELLADLGYQEIKTPMLFNTELWKQSGHFANYKDKMYFVGKDEKWGLKPMNCPEACLVFNEYMRSYKDLPLRLSEFSLLHRYEQAGEINGLFRTREFMIDDAHIFCALEQIEKEILNLIKLTSRVYKRFGFGDYDVELSTRPEKFIGTEKQWEKSEAVLRKILRSQKIKYKENKGEGAFYGPKIDFHIKDSLGREWQLGTIQLDFATAERLEVNYIDESGKKQHPVIIHRAILGSIERFIAILLEHTGGILPFWLAPVQVTVLPISERHYGYAKDIRDKIYELGIRVELDGRNETLEKKIRDAEVQQIPYMIVVGDREVRNKKVAVRDRERGDLGQKELTEFINKIIIE
jgi:threonyl-tRNA synthetase